MSKTMVIVNPNAGKLRNKKRLSQLLQAIKLRESDAHVFFTKQKQDATQLILEQANQYSLIITIGGDGTLNEVITGMLMSHQHIPIGYIAAGTANDFAKTHQLLIKDEKVLDLIQQYNIAHIDIGKFNNRYFSYVAAFGAYTAVAFKTNQKLKGLIGYYAYLLESFSHLSSLKKYPIQLTLDGKKVNENVIFFAMFHATSVGGLLSFKLSQIGLNDGLLDVFYIRYPKNLIQACAIIFALANRSYNHPAIVLTKAKDIEVTSKKDLEWSLDGEDGGNIKEVTATCLNQAIHLVKP